MATAHCAYLPARNSRLADIVFNLWYGAWLVMCSRRPCSTSYLLEVGPTLLLCWKLDLADLNSCACDGQRCPPAACASHLLLAAAVHECTPPSVHAWRMQGVSAPSMLPPAPSPCWYPMAYTCQHLHQQYRAQAINQASMLGSFVFRGAENVELKVRSGVA